MGKAQRVTFFWVSDEPFKTRKKFINTAAGEDVTKVGGGLTSCTSEIQSISVPHPTRDVNIVFVDTPGFIDTYLDNTAILVHLAEWLKTSYVQAL